MEGIHLTIFNNGGQLIYLSLKMNEGRWCQSALLQGKMAGEMLLDDRIAGVCRDKQQQLGLNQAMWWSDGSRVVVDSDEQMENDVNQFEDTVSRAYNIVGLQY